MIFAVVLVTVVNGTLVSATIGTIDRAQALVDVTSPPAPCRPRPQDREVPALRSRGKISAEPASDLSRRDQRKAEIEAFTGRPALEPIRVYAGLRSAGSPEEQARLALADLIRMGAFSPLHIDYRDADRDLEETAEGQPAEALPVPASAPARSDRKPRRRCTPGSGTHSMAPSGQARPSQPDLARDPARSGRGLAPLAAGLRGRLELSRDWPRRHQSGAC